MARERKRTFRVGRARDCDVVLADDSVSRYHAELCFIPGGKLFLTDCHSSNGTAVLANNREIEVRQTHLSKSASVRFGDVVLSVEDLLAAVGVATNPANASVAEPPPAAETSSWVRGDRLVRCHCGAVKRRSENCPMCGG